MILSMVEDVCHAGPVSNFLVARSLSHTKKHIKAQLDKRVGEREREKSRPRTTPMPAFAMRRTWRWTALRSTEPSFLKGVMSGA